MSVWRCRVYQDQEVNLLACRVKLASHLVSHKATVAEASHKIGAFRLHSTHGFNMSRGHLFERGWHLYAIKFIWFQNIKWLLRIKAACQIHTVETTTVPIAMQKEEGSSSSTGLNRHDSGSKTTALFHLALFFIISASVFLYKVRQMFYSRSSKEGRERDLLTRDLLDSINHTSGKERMSSE